MFKINLLLLLSFQSLIYAETVQALDGDISVAINGKQIHLKKNQSVKLSECDNIRFISGKGKLNINHLSFSESTPKKTYSMPCDELSFQSLIGQYLSTTEQTKMGITVRGNDESGKTDYEIRLPTDGTVIQKTGFVATQGFIFIKNDQFHDKQLGVEVKNADGKLFELFQNETTPQNGFKIDAELLRLGGDINVRDLRNQTRLLHIHILSPKADTPDFEL